MTVKEMGPAPVTGWASSPMSGDSIKPSWPEGATVNSVTLYVMLSRNFGSSINYSAEKNELSARCGVKGYVWNTHSKFEHKLCNVSFCKGSPERFSSYANEHNLQTVCGGVTLSAGLEPEKFKADGQELSLPPIEIVIFLEDHAYDKMESLLRSCMMRQQSSSLSLEFTPRLCQEFYVP
jgi:hypothetical protein